jgi:hypothetical protein
MIFVVFVSTGGVCDQAHWQKGGGLFFYVICFVLIISNFLSAHWPRIKNLVINLVDQGHTHCRSSDIGDNGSSTRTLHVQDIMTPAKINPINSITDCTGTGMLASTQRRNPTRNQNQNQKDTEARKKSLSLSSPPPINNVSDPSGHSNPRFLNSIIGHCMGCIANASIDVEPLHIVVATKSPP